jgi:hypothetical protein|tara:strand:- start:986 stop:1297 length:312 start_codon:yes stop_codon:yes gene_type:complete
MGSYAENEQDARECAELQRQFAEEAEEEKTLLAKEKTVVMMDEIMYLRKRNQLISEINTIVGNNILYGQPPHIHHYQPAEEILCDIINDLTSMKRHLELGGNI